MLKETTDKTNDLEDLFKNTLESNIEEIHIKVNEQKNKKEKIMSLIKYFQNSNKETNNTNVDECMEILDLVNSNIKSLYSLEINLNHLVQEFTDTYVTNYSKEYSDSSYDSIKNSIDDCSIELSEIDKDFAEKDEKINNFLNKYSDILNNQIAIENTKEKIIENDDDISEEDITILEESILDESEELVDNNTLIVSEKDGKVYLPYTVSEINDYLEQFPNVYSNFEDVIKKEFIVPLKYYSKNPVISRFREAYALIRDREAKSVIEALKYSFDLMFRYDLNPTIIAACKTQEQLDDYIDCLDRKNLENFKHFKIQFNVNPLATKG